MHSMAWILDRGRDTLFICDLFPPMLLGFACARVCVCFSKLCVISLDKYQPLNYAASRTLFNIINFFLFS